jgi:hypothetical protein
VPVVSEYGVATHEELSAGLGLRRAGKALAQVLGVAPVDADARAPPVVGEQHTVRVAYHAGTLVVRVVPLEFVLGAHGEVGEEWGG